MERPKDRANSSPADEVAGAAAPCHARKARRKSAAAAEATAAEATPAEETAAARKAATAKAAGAPEAAAAPAAAAPAAEAAPAAAPEAATAIEAAAGGVEALGNVGRAAGGEIIAFSSGDSGEREAAATGKFATQGISSIPLAAAAVAASSSSFFPSPPPLPPPPASCLSSSSSSRSSASPSSASSSSSSSSPSSSSSSSAAAALPSEAPRRPDGERLPRSQKKWQRREEYREKKRAQRPQERHRRRRAAKAKLLAAVQNLSPEEQQLFLRRHREAQRAEREVLRKQLQQVHEGGGETALHLCFNCSFSECLMNQKEVRSLAKQLFISYHLVRRCPALGVQLHFTSFSEDNVAFQTCRDLFSFNSWVVHRDARPFWEVFRREQVVVLSPDAEEELLDVEVGKIYVIGGLVDRTICRCESQRQAERLQLTCKRLPIKTFLPSQQRLVLNINAVVEIILHYRQHGDWRAALEAAMPRRMQGIGGRKKERMDKKRQRLATLRQQQEENSEEAADAAARRNRERTWCGGGARNGEFLDDAFNPFDNRRVLSGLASLFTEERDKEAAADGDLREEEEADTSGKCRHKRGQNQGGQTPCAEKQANTKGDRNSGSTHSVGHKDILPPTGAALLSLQSTSAPTGQWAGSGSDERITTDEISAPAVFIAAEPPTAAVAPPLAATASMPPAAIAASVPTGKPPAAAASSASDAGKTDEPVNPLFD